MFEKKILGPSGLPVPDEPKDAGCQCETCGVELLNATVSIHGYQSPSFPAKNPNMPEQVSDHLFCSTECWLAWLETQLLTDPRWMVPVERLTRPADLDAFQRTQFLINRPVLWDWDGWRVEVACIQSTIVPPLEKPENPEDMPPPELWGRPKWHFQISVYGRDIKNDGVVAQTVETAIWLFNPLTEENTEPTLLKIYEVIQGFVQAGEAEKSIYGYFLPNPNKVPEKES